MSAQAARKDSSISKKPGHPALAEKAEETRTVSGSPIRFATVALATAFGLAVIAACAVLPRDDGRAPRDGSQVLVGAGDISVCTNDNDEQTVRLLDDIPGTVYTLGDNVYQSGTDAEFRECYGPTWGRHKARTKPSPGDHEYYTSGASGYYNYFGEAAGDPDEGYYSYDLGSWHVVVLNSRCARVGGCEDGSPMLAWLEEDLAANPATCTAAYWHRPLFSSGEHGNDDEMRPVWDALYAADADVVLNGHDHNYERFAPQDPNGEADPDRGIRQFVVGTGGVALRPFGETRPNSEVRNADTHGVLRLTLSPGSYEWEFVPVAGETFTDSGSGSCH